MTEKIHGYKKDYWGNDREIVSLKNYALVRPIAKEIDWKISEAIGFAGVDRRFIQEEMPNGRTRFTIAKDQEAAFREAGTKRAKYLAERHSRLLREDAAYQVRVKREAAQAEIYARHRRETGEALTEYQAETAAADKAYGEARIVAGEVAAKRKAGAVTEYNTAIDEADEDRDEALAALDD